MLKALCETSLPLKQGIRPLKPCWLKNPLEDLANKPWLWFDFPRGSKKREHRCVPSEAFWSIFLSAVFSSLGINTLVFWFYRLLVWAGLRSHGSCRHCRRLSPEAWRKALAQVSYLCDPVWPWGQRPTGLGPHRQSGPGTETEPSRWFPCDFGKASVAAWRKIR